MKGRSKIDLAVFAFLAGAFPPILPVGPWTYFLFAFLGGGAFYLVYCGEYYRLLDQGGTKLITPRRMLLIGLFFILVGTAVHLFNTVYLRASGNLAPFYETSAEFESVVFPLGVVVMSGGFILGRKGQLTPPPPPEEFQSPSPRQLQNSKKHFSQFHKPGPFFDVRALVLLAQIFRIVELCLSSQSRRSYIDPESLFIIPLLL